MCKFVKKKYMLDLSVMTDDSILGGIFILKYELLISTNSLWLIKRVWNTIVILIQTTELLPCITSWPHIWVMLFVVMYMLYMYICLWIERSTTNKQLQLQFVVILKDLSKINLLNYWLWTGRSSQISCSKMHIICTKTMFNTAEKSSIYLY